jgi:prophage regulatory protein
MASNITRDAHQSPILLRISEVRKLTGLSDSAIYRKAADGTFPRPLKISDRSSAWIESEVRIWIVTRIEARNGGAI